MLVKCKVFLKYNCDLEPIIGYIEFGNDRIPVEWSGYIKFYNLEDNDKLESVFLAANVALIDIIYDEIQK